MLSDDWTPVQFFVEDKPRVSVCEVSVKHVTNDDTGEESLVFRCTCWEFTPRAACPHVREVVTNIKQRGDGRYVTPMLPTTNDKDVDRAASDPKFYRELLLHKSVIRYLHEEEHEDDDAEG